MPGKKNKRNPTPVQHQSIPPDDIDSVFAKALAFHQKGELKTAEELYREILIVEPSHADALHLSGVIAYESKQFSVAESLIKSAISIHPDRAVYHYNIGLVYSEQGNYPSALESFRQAVMLQPDYHDAIYRAGLMLHTLGDIENAVLYYEKALHLNARNPEIWNNLGNIAQSLSRFSDALEYYMRAVDINQDYAEAHNNLGTLYSKIGQNENACRCYLKAIQLKPDLAHAFTNLGNIYHDEKRIDDSIDHYRKALEINPACTETAYRLGVALNSGGKSGESLTWLKRVIYACPEHGQALQMIVSILEYRCDWQDLPDYRVRLRKLTEKALLETETSPEDPFSCLGRYTDIDYHTRVTESYSRGYEAIPEKLGLRFNLDNRDRSDRKLTIGYLSNNFRNHPNAHLVSGLFECHDRNLFSVNCYSYGPDDGSYYRKRIESDCDRFIEISGLGYVEAAHQIYNDCVDILIDFNGYTLGNKMEICALRPAPLQVRYLGFPGSMRASFFDYIITDKILTPPEEQQHYTEKFVYMPDCYQINDNTPVETEESVSRHECGLPADSVVFCSFNTSYKIEPVMFKVWMDILKQVQGSVLWLLNQNEAMVTNLKNVAASQGIENDRLVFAEKIPKNEHLVRLALADIALDTRLVGGHLTTSDALRAGVPVITLQGNHFISRASSSILTHIGLPELVTDSLDTYEKLAVNLALNPEELTAVRKRLNQNRKTKPLFNTSRFVRSYEAGLLKMWELFQKGSEPEQIEISAHP